MAASSTSKRRRPGRRLRWPRRLRRGRKSRLGLWSALAVILLLALYLAVLEYSSPHVSGQRLDLNTFVTFANQGRLRSARVLDQDAIVVGRYVAPSGVVARYNLPYFRSEVLRERLADILLRKRVPTTIDQQFAKSLVLPATLLIPAL